MGLSIIISSIHYSYYYYYPLLLLLLLLFPKQLGCKGPLYRFLGIGRCALSSGVGGTKFVGPWARRLVGALSAPDLVGQSSWARGPVGPWLVGALSAPDLVGQSSWARGPVGPCWYLVSSI